MTPHRLWARCIAGLEAVAVQEITSRCGPSTIEQRPRGVLFAVEDVAPALALRTVDDVYLGGIAAEGIGHKRSALRDVATAVRGADPLGVARARPTSRSPALVLEVSASFAGRRNYNRFDIEDEAGGELSRVLGIPYASRRDGGVPPTERVLAWRVHLDRDVTLIGLRLAQRTLHRRHYKQSSVAGTLHPPVAAALVLLARPTTDTLIVDPTCGAATIPIEAQHLQPTLRVIGADLSAAVLAAASINVAAARVNVALVRSDATRLPLGDATASTVITNPPWGRQALAAGGLRHEGLGALWREAARVLRPGGVVVALTEEDAPSPAHPQLAATSRTRLTLRGTRSVATTLEVT